jgi:hypothetical protein
MFVSVYSGTPRVVFPERERSMKISRRMEWNKSKVDKNKERKRGQRKGGAKEMKRK